MSNLARNEAIAISIIFLLVNQGEFILDAIAYFEAELELDFEVIIINLIEDDTSNTEVLTYLHHQGYNIFELPATENLPQILNFAIEQSSSQYILPILGSQKVLAPRILEAINVFNCDIEIGFIFSYFFKDDFVESWDFLQNPREVYSIFRKAVWQTWSQEPLNLSDEQDYIWKFWLNGINEGWKFHYLPHLLDVSLESKVGFDVNLDNKDCVLNTKNLKSKLENLLQNQQHNLSTVQVEFSGLNIQEPPLVSICIPTYNGERFIGEAISSALSQTYPFLEVIISDDGSKDRTLAIANSFKDNTSVPISILTHQHYGLSENCNFSVRQSKGKYIKFLFQDDLLHPQCIEKMVTLAEEDEEIGLVFSPREIFFAENAECDPDLINIFRSFSNLHLAWVNLKPIQWGCELFKNNKIFHYPLNKIGEPTTVLLRREVFNQIGFFDAKLNQLMDLDLWWRVCGYFKVGFVEQTLSYFRLHPHQQTYHNIQKLEANDFQFYWKIYQDQFYDFLTPVQRYEALLIYTISLNDKCLYANSNPVELIAKLRELRRKIAEILLNSPDADILSNYEGSLGRIHQILCRSKTIKQPLTSNEQEFVTSLKYQLSESRSNFEVIKYLLAIMLYLNSNEVPDNIKLDLIPSKASKALNRWLKYKKQII